MTEEFKPITTQADFDSIIKDRLERNTKSVTDEVTKKFEGYISPDDLGAKTADLTKKINDLNAAIAERDGSIADLTAKNKAYEVSAAKMRIAGEYRIPLELAGRLSGETEDEIKADAETFSKLVGHTQTAPLGSTEPAADKGNNAAYRNLLNGLTND